MPKDVSKKDNKEKKEKKHFFRDFKAELKRVIWPTPKQLVNNTVAVITIVLITAVIVFVLDVAFEKITTNGINQLKQVVESHEPENETTNSVSNEETSNSEVQNNEVGNSESTNTTGNTEKTNSEK